MKRSTLIWIGVVIAAVIVARYTATPSATTSSPAANATSTATTKTTSATNTATVPHVQTPLPAAKPASSVTLPATNTIKAKSVTVSILEEEFTPKNITVTKGTVVTWVNKGTKSHTVKAPPGGPASPTLKPGQSYSFTFTIPGTVNYHCDIHPGIGGTVNVVE